MSLPRDAWTGLAVLAASLFLFWLTLDLKDSPLVPIGPGFYPRIVLGFSALLGALLLGASLLARKEDRPLAKANYGAVVLHFAVFGLFVAALPWLGFRIATFAYVAAANALMAPPATARQWLRVALIAFGTSLVTYYAFEQWLTVLLPRGRWTDW